MEAWPVCCCHMYRCKISASRFCLCPLEKKVDDTHPRCKVSSCSRLPRVTEQHFVPWISRPSLYCTFSGKNDVIKLKDLKIILKEKGMCGFCWGKRCQMAALPTKYVTLFDEDGFQFKAQPSRPKWLKSCNIRDQVFAFYLQKSGALNFLLTFFGRAFFGKRHEDRGGWEGGVGGPALLLHWSWRWWRGDLHKDAILGGNRSEGYVCV